jgi:hypothetical protein
MNEWQRKLRALHCAKNLESLIDELDGFSDMVLSAEKTVRTSVDQIDSKKLLDYAVALAKAQDSGNYHDLTSHFFESQAWLLSQVSVVGNNTFDPMLIARCVVDLEERLERPDLPNIEKATAERFLKAIQDSFFPQSSGEEDQNPHEFREIQKTIKFFRAYEAAEHFDAHVAGLAGLRPWLKNIRYGADNFSFSKKPEKDYLQDPDNQGKIFLGGRYNSVLTEMLNPNSENNKYASKIIEYIEDYFSAAEQKPALHRQTSIFKDIWQLSEFHEAKEDFCSAMDIPEKAAAWICADPDKFVGEENLRETLTDFLVSYYQTLGKQSILNTAIEQKVAEIKHERADQNQSAAMIRFQNDVSGRD